MIPTQTLESYPVFGDNATKIQPDGAKYSNGFIEGDVYPAEWVNWAWNKNTKGMTDANAGISSMEAEINSVLTNAGKTPDVSENNQLLLSIQKLINDAETRAKLAAHPVGSLYWSSQSTDPSTLFGGTWTRIKDRFIWAAGDSDTIDATGGAKTVTLETANLPAHTHSVGAHKHGLNSHVHSMNNHTHTLSHTHTLNNGNTASSGTTQTAGIRHSGNTGAMSQHASHTHKLRVLNSSSYISGNGCYGASNSGVTANGIIQLSYDASRVYSAVASLVESTSVEHSHSMAASYIYGKTDGASATTTSQATGNTGSASGDTANSTAFDSGSTGSGTAVDKMPPYQIKYCWERTA